jgi:hypothetical protein
MSLVDDAAGLAPGFVAGLAFDLLTSQIAKMLGVKIDSAAEFDRADGHRGA